MKYKVIDSSYDIVTGRSEVTIGSPIGVFTASSQLLDEDRDLASRYAGCHYAEVKCVIKMTMAQLSRARAEYKAIKEVHDAITKSENSRCAEKTPEHAVIHRVMNAKKRYIERLEHNINKAKEMLQKEYEQRGKEIKKILEKVRSKAEGQN